MVYIPSVPETQDPNRVPPGHKYRLIATGNEESVKANKYGRETTTWAVDFKVLAPATVDGVSTDGCELTDFITFTVLTPEMIAQRAPDAEETKYVANMTRMWKEKLEALGFPMETGKPLKLEKDMVVGKTCVAMIKDDDYSGKVRSRIKWLNKDDPEAFATTPTEKVDTSEIPF